MDEERRVKPPRDKVEEFTSKANRGNVPYEAPIAAYARAKAREQAGKEKHRLERMRNQGIPVQHTDAEYRRMERDHIVKHIYREHYTDYRGVATQKRGNLVWPIPEE